MSMQTRLAKLERARPARVAPMPLDLSRLPADLVMRVEKAFADVSFPQSLGDYDLRALAGLDDKQGPT